MLSTKTLSRISYKLRISPNGNEKCRFEHIDNMKATPKAQSQKEIHHPPAFGQVEGDLWTTARGDTATGSWEYDDMDTKETAEVNLGDPGEMLVFEANADTRIGFWKTFAEVEARRPGKRRDVLEPFV
jgi:hypothetical protein